MQSDPASRASAPATEREESLAELARAESDLEASLAHAVKRVESLTSRGTELEQRAMQAIRDGDDAAAREALVAHQECTDELAQLQADATVLRASIADCRALRATMTEG